MTSPSNATTRPSAIADSGFIPVRLSGGHPSLDVAVLCRAGVAGREALVPLRQATLGIAYLACLLDSAGTVHGWLELWVQRFDLPPGASAARVNANRLGDEAFDAWRQAVGCLEFDAVVTLPEPSRPLLLDRATHTSAERVAGEWTLCKRDEVVAAAGLSAYSSGTVRYLTDGNGRFVSLSNDAPVEDAAPAIDEMARLASDQVPFNTQCGKWFATRWLPLSLEEHLSLIGGDGWVPPLHGRTPVPTNAAAVALRQQDSRTAGSLFLVHQSPQQRVAEALHLKLLALYGAVRAVAAATRASGRPLLSVHLDSFRVGYSLPANFTPLLWSADVRLVKPSFASALPADLNGRQYFTSTDTAAGSVFAADAAAATRAGRVNVRIRQTLQVGAQGHVVEATLSGVDPIVTARGDELWLSLLTTAGTVSLIGAVEPSGADRTLRFRSRPTQLSDGQAAWFEQSAGLATRDVPFEVLRTRGSPSDLYSLGVLGLRCLFDGPSAPHLGVLIDELIASSQAPDEDLGEAFQTRLSSSADIREQLGPRFVMREPLSADEAFDAIPSALWSSILATISRMLSGAGPHSTCRDLAGNGADASVFDVALNDLAQAIVQTRSLVLNELYYNRRVARVVDSMMNARS